MLLHLCLLVPPSTSHSLTDVCPPFLPATLSPLYVSLACCFHFLCFIWKIWNNLRIFSDKLFNMLSVFHHQENSKCNYSNQQHSAVAVNFRELLLLLRNFTVICIVLSFSVRGHCNCPDGGVEDWKGLWGHGFTSRAEDRQCWEDVRMADDIQLYFMKLGMHRHKCQSIF